MTDAELHGQPQLVAWIDERLRENLVSQLEELGLVSRVERDVVRLRGFPKNRTDLSTGKTTGEPEEVTMPGWSRLRESLDAHPLVRQHFGRRVREASEAAWREGHRRVFVHLCDSTPYWPEGEDGLRPLYQAVAHGC